MHSEFVNDAITVGLNGQNLKSRFFITWFHVSYIIYTSLILFLGLYLSSEEVRMFVISFTTVANLFPTSTLNVY